jgi:hypothetical protein
MRISQITRNLAGPAALLALVAVTVHTASAGEKLVATDGSVRTNLAFKVPDTAAQKMIPEGWQVSPFGEGPSKGANLTVSFIDWTVVQNPDGTPGQLDRVVVVVIPAKKKGTDATVPMVGPAFISSRPGAPGPYGTAAPASAAVDRHVRTDLGGTTYVEESWEFKGDGGDVIQLQLQYVLGVPIRSKLEITPHSAVKPDFYRIYRIEQAADVVRSTAAGTDRAQKYAFKAAGAKLSPLFDGSEQLISITSIPFYTRQIFLPEEVTQ